jgi:hypothetical protein
MLTIAFDLFTVQNSFFQANGTKDPNFTGSFGLAWYQSDTPSIWACFWFDNPQDAAALPTCHFDPTKPTPFNGEHKAGPFAMLSVPDAQSGLAPSARTRIIPRPQPPAPSETLPADWTDLNAKSRTNRCEYN